MNSVPLVSIVIPTYNQNPGFLRACIASAINQNYSNFEVIVSDNKSTQQNVQDVYNEFSGHKQFTMVRPDEHVSMIDNFAFAAGSANGQYLSFLCSDDLLEPNAISILVNAVLENPEVNKLAFGDIECVEANSLKHQYFARKLEFSEKTYEAKELIGFFLNRKNMVWMNGNLIETSAYREVGGIKSEGLYYAHDDAFIFKWVGEGRAVTYINKLLGKVRVWDDNQKAEPNRDKKYVNDIIEAYRIALNSKYIADNFGYANVIKIRNAKIEEHALYWCVNYIKRKTLKADWEDVKLMMLNECKTFKVRLYFFCCKQPFKEILYLLITAKNKLIRKEN